MDPKTIQIRNHSRLGSSENGMHGADQQRRDQSSGFYLPRPLLAKRMLLYIAAYDPIACLEELRKRGGQTSRHSTAILPSFESFVPLKRPVPSS